MGKRKNQQQLIDSDSDSSDDGSGSDLDSEFLSLAKKKKKAPADRAASTSPAKSTSESDSDWDGGGKNSGSNQTNRKKKRTKKMSRSSSESNSDDSDDESDANEPSTTEGVGSVTAVSSGNAPSAAVAVPVAAVVTAKKQQPQTLSTVEKEKSDKSEAEEGEVSSDGSIDDDDDDSDSSSDSEFNDGFDENLMGDSDDRARLEGLSEKERETEIFKRIERRDVMRTRWEIERKLRQAKKAERDKDKTITPADKKRKEERKRKRKRAKLAAAAAAAARPVVKETMPPPLALPPIPKCVQPAVEQRREDTKPVTAAAAAAASTGAEYATPVGTSQDDDEEENWDDEPNFVDPKERSKERKKTVEANKTDDKRSNAMAMLKAKREGKMKREEEEAKRQAERDTREDKEEIDGVSNKSSMKLKASDIYSDDSGSDSDDDGAAGGGKRSDKRSSSSSRSSSDSDNDDDSKVKKGASSTSSSSASKRAPVYISTKEELHKVRLSRHKIERFVALPHFDRVVQHCFVRISIGNRNNQPIYRVAEITGVVETAKIYLLGKCRTNKGLRLKFGSAEKVFRLEFISNQDFSDGEFEKWKETCAQTDVDLPTIDFVEKKVKEIREAIVYEFKDEDVHKIIEEKNRFRKYPTNYAMKKTTLMNEREAALLRGEDDVAADFNLQIEELDERANVLDKNRSSTLSSIAYINDRNRKRNVAEAEKAIMEEVRASKGMRSDDPFTRRCTKPTMMFKARDPNDDLAPMIPAPLPPGRKNRPQERKIVGPAENNLYSLHDFEIDLDVALPNNSVNALPKPIAKIAEAAPKRSLNLEAYKKKRGLI